MQMKVSRVRAPRFTHRVCWDGCARPGGAGAPHSGSDVSGKPSDGGSVEFEHFFPANGSASSGRYLPGHARGRTKQQNHEPHLRPAANADPLAFSGSFPKQTAQGTLSLDIKVPGSVVVARTLSTAIRCVGGRKQRVQERSGGSQRRPGAGQFSRQQPPRHRTPPTQPAQPVAADERKLKNGKLRKASASAAKKKIQKLLKLENRSPGEGPERRHNPAAGGRRPTARRGHAQPHSGPATGRRC